MEISSEKSKTIYGITIVNSRGESLNAIIRMNGEILEYIYTYL